MEGWREREIFLFILPSIGLCRKTDVFGGKIHFSAIWPPKPKPKPNLSTYPDGDENFFPSLLRRKVSLRGAWEEDEERLRLGEGEREEEEEEEERGREIEALKKRGRERESAFFPELVSRRFANGVSRKQNNNHLFVLTKTQPPESPYTRRNIVIFISAKLQICANFGVLGEIAQKSKKRRF